MIIIKEGNLTFQFPSDWHVCNNWGQSKVNITGGSLLLSQGVEKMIN
jgi:hypothetical protein